MRGPTTPAVSRATMEPVKVEDEAASHKRGAGQSTLSSGYRARACLCSRDYGLVTRALLWNGYQWNSSLDVSKDQATSVPFIAPYLNIVVARGARTEPGTVTESVSKYMAS